MGFLCICTLIKKALFNLSGLICLIALLEGGNRAGELNLTFMKSCVAVYLGLVSNHCFVCGLQ